MSSSLQRLPLERARAIAADLVELLAPACSRIEVAGSIRRGRADVGDVEVVAIPIMEDEPSTPDMFGMPVQTSRVNRLDELCERLLGSGVFQHRLNRDGRKGWGSELKWGVFQDFAIDIYSAKPETWGVLFAIRTGSAEFSHKLVTSRSQGGFCPSHLRFSGWRVVRRHTEEPIPTPEEADVFRVLGLEYMEPSARTDRAWPRRIENVR